MEYFIQNVGGSLRTVKLIPNKKSKQQNRVCKVRHALGQLQYLHICGLITSSVLYCLLCAIFLEE